MIKRSSLTITLASHIYGYGHFKRMENFNKILTKHSIKNYITHFNQYNLFLDKKKIKINYLTNFILKKNIELIILDLSNSKFLKSEIFLKLIKLISKLNLPVVIFDDFSKKIYENLKFFNKNIVICPYIYDDKFLEMKTKKYKNLLVGTKYSILTKNKRIIKKNYELKKVLISCGGTDFKKLTIKLIEILKNIKYLKINVIIGPHFDKKQRDKINKLNYLNLKIFHNVDNLIQIAKRNDLAIITSGLTKYEFLSVGMRFAVISENKEFYKFHNAFSKKKLCYNLGYYKNFNLLKFKVEKLLKEYRNYNQLVKNKSIDTNGANRIIKIIKQKFF